MGIYNYHCPKCNATKVVEHKIAATPYVRCNQCAAVMVRTINPKKEENGRDKNIRP